MQQTLRCPARRWTGAFYGGQDYEAALGAEGGWDEWFGSSVPLKTYQDIAILAPADASAGCSRTNRTYRGRANMAADASSDQGQ